MKKIRAEYVEFNKKGSFNEICEDCTLGKLTRLSQKTVDKINKDPNHGVIHSEIVGPMRTQSLGFKIYI